VRDERRNSDRPLRVGLTGGIASGKSTVAGMFAELGAIVIDTDVIAREVVRPGEPALDEIRAAFGAGVILDDGTLNRRALREIVFSDPGLRRRLEGIVHPRIRAETVRRAETAGGPYQLIVVPLLVESPLKDVVDRILVVDCEESAQIRRLVARDGESEAGARRMLAAQSSRDERLAVADDVIHNDGDLVDTRRQVATLHRTYLEQRRPRRGAR
jgi:dephospho-CoA kinase